MFRKSRYANLALAETANIQGESFRNASIDGGEQPVWVKMRNPRGEQFLSAMTAIVLQNSFCITDHEISGL